MASMSRTRNIKTKLATSLALFLMLTVNAQQMEPRNQDIPRRLSDLRRELRIGQIWLTSNNDHLQAVRASFQLGDKMVAAMTLNPNDGNPVALSERGNYRPNQNPGEAKLNTYLRDLRQDNKSMRFGAYILPSSRGHEVQVYWSGKLVSYLYLNPKNFEPSKDEDSDREANASALKVH